MRRIVVNDPRTPALLAKTVGSNDCQCYGSFGIEVDGQVVGGATWDNYNRVNCFVHFSVNKGTYFGRSFLTLMFSYLFHGLRVKRVSAAFSSANEKVKRLATLIGFKIEATLQAACPDGDMEIWMVTPKECRFLL